MITGWGSATDRGLVRATNEDALLAEPPMFVVADGMGGHAAGDVAAWTAVEAFAALARRATLGVQDANDAVAAANEAILQAAAAQPERAGMGTTVCGLASVVAGGMAHWLVFNVGDSRVYRLVHGSLQQLTVDHSEAEELVAEGRLTRDQAQLHHLRHVVTRSLGTEPAPVVDSWVFPPGDTERFVLCSDGLTTEVADAQIAACLADEQDPQRAAAQLVGLALDAGGRDNVTVIVVDAIAEPGDGGADTNTEPRGSRG